MPLIGDDALIVTETSASAASVTATAAAISTKKHQVVAFSGSSNAQAIKLELKFGSTVQLTLHSAANVPVGHFFGETGVVGGSNEAISVVVTPAATGQCDVNLIYRSID